MIGSIIDAVGNTPLLELKNIESLYGLKARLAVKLEYLNPSGSAKDRAALQMVKDAEAKGILKEGSVIIEPTSGNTGIGLAMISAVRGYRLILTMPDTMSKERITLLKAYGAEIHLSKGSEGMSGAIALADRLAEGFENSFIPSQFDNPSNAKAHYLTTGPEIYGQCEGNVDIFVAGVGTGGTLTGTARFLKEKKSDLHVVAVEPFNSPLLSQGKAGPHGLQGIGANFVPSILGRELIDEVITVKEEDAYETARNLARKEGVFCGITSGAALWASIQLALREENAGKTIVCVLPDSGDRYLSTPLYSGE